MIVQQPFGAGTAQREIDVDAHVEGGGITVKPVRFATASLAR